MKEKIFYILILSVLFLGYNLTTAMGLERNLVLLFFLLLGLVIIAPKIKYSAPKALKLLLIFVIIYGILRNFFDTREGTRFLIIQIIGTPILFSAANKFLDLNIVPDRYIRLWSKIFKALIFSFLVVTGMALVERVTGHIILGWSDVTYEGVDISTEFRSTSLLGHPLANALFVTIIMNFLLITPIRNKYKYGLWTLGFVSLLCFNTRSSIVGCLLMMGLYVARTIVFNRKVSLTTKISTVFLSVIIGGLCYVLVYNYGFGGRLLDMGLFDDSSAQTRVNAWDFINYIKINDLLYGISFDQKELLKLQLGVFGLENFWIDMTLGYGLLIFIPYVLLTVKVIRETYKGYSLFDALFTTSAFVLTASTNNSLATDFTPLFVFLICCVLFHPDNIKHITPNKYLTE